MHLRCRGRGLTSFFLNSSFFVFLFFNHIENILNTYIQNFNVLIHFGNVPNVLEKCYRGKKALCTKLLENVDSIRNVNGIYKCSCVSK